MTYRNQGRLAVSLLVMGVTFFVTGCCVRFVNPGTANSLRWLLPLIGLVLSFIVFRLQRKGGNTMTSAIYYEETQALVSNPSQEDQAYFQDLWDYFNFAGFLYEEKALREQVYNLALDFFGKQTVMDGRPRTILDRDPKGMADQIIENMPKESTRSVLKI